MNAILINTRLSLLLILCLFATSATAQEFMPVRVGFYPGAVLSDAPAGSPAENVEIGLSTYSFAGNFQRHWGDTRLINGLFYEVLQVDILDGEGDLILTPETMHYVRYDLRMVHSFSPNWSLAAYFGPGIASDFDEVGRDDIRIQASVLLLGRSSRQFGYGFGVAYTSDFGRPLVVPLLRLDWSGDNVHLDALLPTRAYLGYALGSHTEIGLSAGITGTQYNINLEQDIVTVLEADTDIDLPAKYSVLTFGPTLKRRLSGSLLFVTEAGITGWRRFEFNGDVVNQTLDQDRSLYVRFGVAYNPNFLQ